jgi:hypothetical protein
MFRTILCCLIIGVVCGLPLGCGPSVKQKDIPIEAPSQLEQAKQYLQNYANGQPLGSEVTAFPDLVEQLRKSDPAKAEILDKGFKDLQAGGNLAAKAKALLTKLQ